MCYMFIARLVLTKGAPEMKLVELCGMQGNGKTTLHRNLTELYGMANQSQYRLPRPFNLGNIMIKTIQNLPTCFLVGLDQNSFKRLRYLVYFDVLAQDLIHVSRNGAGLLLWDEGPVTAIASIRRSLACRNQIVWESVLSEKAKRLIGIFDGLIWLDAPDSILIERVRARQLNRWLQVCSLDEIREFYKQYREIYESVMAIYIHNQVPVLKISTAEYGPVETARMVREFVESLGDARQKDR